MLAVVKTPRTNATLFEVKGDVPPNVMAYLSKQFGQNLHVIDEDDEELVNVFESQWYKATTALITPGDRIKIYRDNLAITQGELGEKLGNLSAQAVADMEENRCPIPQDVAERLSVLFNIPVERFQK